MARKVRVSDRKAVWPFSWLGSPLDEFTLVSCEGTVAADIEAAARRRKERRFM